MAHRTDPSAEFGRPGSEFGRTDREFGPAHPSDITPPAEFRPPEEEAHIPAGGEFPSDFHVSAPGPSDPDAAPTPREKRKNRLRRSLLLQWAAVGAAVVVVTNSFGGDLLGNDVLVSGSIYGSCPFPPSAADPVHPDPQPSEDPLPPEDPQPTDETLGPLAIWLEDGTYFYPYQDGECFEMEGIRYDPETNTLYIANLTAETIEAARMGSDFTLHITGENHIGHIQVNGIEGVSTGDLTITGAFKAKLIVNEDRSYVVGIQLAAGGTPAVLHFSWLVDVTAYGSSYAVLVSDTTAETAITMDPVTKASSPIVSGPSHPSTPEDGLTDWIFSDGEDLTAYLNEVTFKDTFGADYYFVEKVREPFEVHAQDPFDLTLSNRTVAGYSRLRPNSTFTVHNYDCEYPLFVYAYRYTKHEESFPVEYTEFMDEDLQTMGTIDMAGKYFNGGSLAYLTKDGSWAWDVNILGYALPEDCMVVERGTDVTSTLPDDGSDSYYLLYVCTYVPEQDQYYYAYTYSYIDHSLSPAS